MIITLVEPAVVFPLPLPHHPSLLHDWRLRLRYLGIVLFPLQVSKVMHIVLTFIMDLDVLDGALKKNPCDDLFSLF